MLLKKQYIKQSLLLTCWMFSNTLAAPPGLEWLDLATRATPHMASLKVRSQTLPPINRPLTPEPQQTSSSGLQAPLTIKDEAPQNCLVQRMLSSSHGENEAHCLASLFVTGLSRAQEHAILSPIVPSSPSSSQQHTVILKMSSDIPPANGAVAVSPQKEVTLPHEIWHVIMQIAGSEGTARLANVSRYLYIIAHDPWLWRQLLIQDPLNYDLRPPQNRKIPMPLPPYFAKDSNPAYEAWRGERFYREAIKARKNHQNHRANVLEKVALELQNPNAMMLAAQRHRFHYDSNGNLSPHLQEARVRIVDAARLSHPRATLWLAGERHLLGDGVEHKRLLQVASQQGSNLARKHLLRLLEHDRHVPHVIEHLLTYAHEMKEFENYLIKMLVKGIPELNIPPANSSQAREMLEQMLTEHAKTSREAANTAADEASYADEN